MFIYEYSSYKSGRQISIKSWYFMGLPAPDRTVAWNGKVPPEAGVVVID